jgi:hypothetical protein
VNVPTITPSTEHTVELQFANTEYFPGPPALQDLDWEEEKKNRDSGVGGRPPQGVKARDDLLTSCFLEATPLNRSSVQSC